MSTQKAILNNRYELLAQHGSGGMSVIYRARDLALGREVAVKILRPSLTNDQSFLDRFRLEARNVANLQHPNIVTVHDVGQDGPTHYIVMELIEGSDLKKIIRADAPFSIDRSLEVAIKICAGIGYAHRAKLVHADVKPQNILLLNDTDTNLKVTDFGIAQALAATNPNERQDVVWGSPHYFSPEQAQGKYPSTESDVYSIGIVIFEMLTGRLPFMGNDQKELAMAHIREPAPLMRDINPQIPENLDRIIQKVLSKEPSARYRMADQLGRILANYRDQGQQSTSDQAPVVQANLKTQPSESVSAERARYGPPAGDQPAVPSAAPPYYQQPPLPTWPNQQPVTTTSPNQSTRPENVRDTGYYTPVDPPQLDMVTILLGLIALLAVVGMVILWVFVLQAYYP